MYQEAVCMSGCWLDELEDIKKKSKKIAKVDLQNAQEKGLIL
jgi:hypothetical protein